MAKFILSKSIALKQHDLAKTLGLVSYSFKTNPKVGQILEENTDCFFSVHFINELDLIKDKSRVWFLSQALNNNLLEKIVKKGVNKFVIENSQDLHLLLNYIKHHNLKIDLLLRMKLKENTIKTEKYYVFGLESNKVNELIKELSKEDLIENLGVHFHRKTQNVSEWDLIREVEELIDEDNWNKIKYLNIGGGLPVMYKNITDKAIDSVINKIKELNIWLKNKSVQLIVEPGRFICAPSIKLETEIVGIHENTIVVDASVYNSSPDTLIVPIKLLVEDEVDIENNKDAKPYVIKGITPCSTDLFRYRVYFNKQFKLGDKIVFENAGAYNFHTEFCELDKINTEIVE